MIRSSLWFHILVISFLPTSMRTDHYLIIFSLFLCRLHYRMMILLFNKCSDISKIYNLFQSFRPINFTSSGIVCSPHCYFVIFWLMNKAALEKLHSLDLPSTRSNLTPSPALSFQLSSSYSVARLCFRQYFIKPPRWKASSPTPTCLLSSSYLLFRFIHQMKSW